MPKMKSHSGTKKRITKTGSGKLKRSSACQNHLMSHKTPKQNRKSRNTEIVSPSDVKRIKHQIPYL